VNTGQLIASYAGSGDWITVITHATATFTGEMVLPDGTVISPTGKAFDVEFGTSGSRASSLNSISKIVDRKACQDAIPGT
jgi:hypothetical protein